MWFFVDETWSPTEFRPKFGILFGTLIKDDQLVLLDKFLFSIRRKYYGIEHAKDLHRELKGNSLLSQNILKKWSKNQPIPNNICIVKEILSYPIQRPDFFLKVFASTVFSDSSKKPGLLSPNPKKLATPFRTLIENVSKAASEHDPSKKVTLVFDQRLDAQKDIAIAVNNFVAGLNLPNIEPYPYFAVSNVSPGVQLADIFAYLLSKYIQGKRPLDGLYRDLSKLKWVSISTPKRYGFNRYDEKITKNVTFYTVRRRWA